MKVAVLKETFPGERRVALTPANVPALVKAGMQVAVEPGAGADAGFPDEEYAKRGATLGPRQSLFDAEILLQVRTLGANPSAGRDDLPRLRTGQILIGLADPLGAAPASREMAATGASLFALELIPRITRAQSMDVLSSMATIAGYRAVLLAAVELPKMFPMLMTAAGTVTAAKVFVLGAGVAGLQAIATARRLGAVVQAYDLRPDTREQIESLGGKFVELKLEAADAQDKGGYAKAMGEEFYQRQRELLANVVEQSDVVICTAAIPGKKSPLLVTADAVRRMKPGGVIVDLAAERGGNCELSTADQRVSQHGVTILGPTNIAAEVPHDASLMFSNNVTKFLLNLVKNGELRLHFEDQIIAETLVTHEGDVYNNRVRTLLGLPPLETLQEEEAEEEPGPAPPGDPNAPLRVGDLFADGEKEKG